MSTGQRLKRAREAAGISQARLAALVGVSPSTPYRWEAGKANPQTGAMERKVAFALGVPVAEIFPCEEPDSPDPARTENGAAVA